MASKPYSLRLADRTVRLLVEEAGRRGVAPRTLAQDLVDEGLRMRRHPVIQFVDRAAGRRACLARHPRISVVDVIETIRGSDTLDDAAAYLSIQRSEVDQVLGYYAEFKDEVDAEINERHEYAEREHRLWRERQQLLER